MRIVLAVSLLLLALPACSRGALVDTQLSPPITTGTEGDEVVWWAEHRAHERSNDTRVIMCQRGQRPVCVRLRAEDR